MAREQTVSVRVDNCYDGHGTCYINPREVQFISEKKMADGTFSTIINFSDKWLQVRDARAADLAALLFDEVFDGSDENDE